MSPFSKFGVACLVLALCITKLVFAHYDMDVREQKKILMTELHDLVCANRRLKRKVEHLKHLSEAEDSVIDELEAILAAKTSLSQDESLDKALLALRRTNQSQLEEVVGTLIEDELRLHEHQKLCKQRISANTFMEEYRRNEKDYFAVVVGLGFEAVIDTITEWQASCDFSHSKGTEGYEQCLLDSPLTKAKRVLLADFVAVLVCMVAILLGLVTLGKLGLGEACEEEEGEEEGDQDPREDEGSPGAEGKGKVDRVHTTQFGTKVFLGVPCLLYTSPSPRDS
eukprot:TRINITY_DN6046_c0_g3_i1.p1 TRINITY_DN6046_c0_g3~~TRINITY_DN6046_c0_g3_i1.p1  ORF type:complete len:282 (-),score=103.77 TRINITY_DN6046_c0_g3_i1:146-991(-)